jgi:HK97 family phage major capsid protein
MDKFTEQRNNFITEMESLVNKAEQETRSLTGNEATRYNELKAKVTAIDTAAKHKKELRALEIQNGGNDSQKDEIREFDSMLRQLGGGMPEVRANVTYGSNGAIIPTSIIPKIIDKVENISPLFAAATKYAVKGDITIPFVNTSDGDITVAFADEFSVLNGSAIKFSSITLKGYLAAALVLVSKQMINNTNFDIVSYIINYIAKKIAAFTENFLINGNTVKNVKSGLKNSVTQQVTTAAGAITTDTLIDIQDAIPDAYQGNACFIMSPKTRTAIRKLKDGQGNYILVTDFSNSNPTGWNLLGKPVYITDNIKSIAEAAAGEDVIYYGDFSGLAVKTGESAEIQVLNELYAPQNAVGLNVWFEMDCTVEDTQKIAKLSIKTE